MPEEARPPEEIIIAGRLTLKDYYDLRDLRLLLWNLRRLCERYDVRLACDAVEDVKPAVESKIREIVEKLRG